jgi:hypothetical protein
LREGFELLYASDVFGARELHVHVDSGGGSASGSTPGPELEQLRVDVGELHVQVLELETARREAAAALLGFQERQDRIYRLLVREGALPRGREARLRYGTE